MRDLKFRQPVFNDDGSFRYWVYWGYIGGDFIAPEEESDSYQYIGIKKNDIEVYEGDILSPVKRLKKYENQVIEYCAADNFAGFVTRGELTFDECDEVIGNVVETPELKPD